MHLEKWRVVFLGLLLLVALPLLGVGCKKQEAGVPPQDSGEPVTDANPSVQDSGPVIPEGWQVYRNAQWRMSIAYPAGWYYRERTAEEIGSGDSLTVDFDNEPVVPRETEPFYLEGIFSVRRGTLAEALAVPDGVALVAQETVMVYGNEMHKQVTRTEFGAEPVTAVSYVIGKDGKIYELSGFEDSPSLAQVAQTIQIGGGQ